MSGVLSKLAIRGLESVVFLSAATIACALIGLVVARYVLNVQVVGLHGIALVAAMWMYMMGALLASYNRSHLEVTFLSQMLTTQYARHIHRLYVSVVTFVIIAFYVYWSYRMFAWSSRFSVTMSELNIPLAVPQSAIYVNALGSIAFALRDVLYSIKLLRNGSE